VFQYGAVGGSWGMERAKATGALRHWDWRCVRLVDRRPCGWNPMDESRDSEAELGGEDMLSIVKRVMAKRLKRYAARRRTCDPLHHLTDIRRLRTGASFNGPTLEQTSSY
jgi:hypothetical protein